MHIPQAPTPLHHRLIPQRPTRLGWKVYLLTAVVSTFTGFYVFDPYMRAQFEPQQQATAAAAGGAKEGAGGVAAKDPGYESAVRETSNIPLISRSGNPPPVHKQLRVWICYLSRLNETPDR
ncbi:uncharacterized protein EV422DRAFT_568694 [Fimicolochytrium jonesii]|uniref:uncharacterized protein n=1 Tax=Fimicolochytrium jonesii TaxID=1396493 RepID=UPI0022FE1B30|nr:uncharacterized protein EV422DRAFT_568694 [Fimicolochytrium jonesii]KAI8819734.1 hypothetical protein EV422DRAFT_568694 [Fimicolochytrium jonesii]